MLCEEIRLTLRELEAFASLGLTGFLTLYGARVAGHEALCTESGLILGIDFHESAGDGETESLGLAFVTAAVDVSVDIVLLSTLKSVEGLLNDVLKNRRGEIDVKGTLVDNNVTVALSEINSGYGCLTAANCIHFFHLLLLFQFVDIDYFEIAYLMAVLRTIVYVKIAELLGTE